MRGNITVKRAVIVKWKVDLNNGLLALLVGCGVMSCCVLWVVFGFGPSSVSKRRALRVFSPKLLVTVFVSFVLGGQQPRFYSYETIGWIV